MEAKANTKIISVRIDGELVTAHEGDTSSKPRAPMENTFLRSAISKVSAPSALAASAWSSSPAPIACCPPAPRPCRKACRSRPPRPGSRFTGAWPSSCSSSSATTSAPRASPTATASCNPWRSRSASPTCATPTTTPACTVDMSHPRFVLDHNRCILCTRCVRVCAEVEGAHVWEVSSRGIYSRIVSDLKDDWGHAQQLHRLRQMRAGLSHRRARGKRLRRPRDGQGKRQDQPPGHAARRPYRPVSLRAGNRRQGRAVRTQMHPSIQHEKGCPRACPERSRRIPALGRGIAPASSLPCSLGPCSSSL